MTSPSRPPRLVRPLLRAPRLLYRLRLARLLGRRFLLVEHRGRRSGRVRSTVLEVVRYDAAAHEATVVSAWGTSADWYRNVTALPVVNVHIGSEHWPSPRTRVLDAEETFRLLEEYRHRHRLAARVLARILRWPLDGTEEERRAFAARMPAVAFRPASDVFR